LKQILETKYKPASVETKWYKHWEERGLFSVKPDSAKTPYTIVIPPPNITGILHMGHALNNTIQDILIRWKKMSGFNALWLPGTDHAGIATQNVVERKLAIEHKSRQALGREKFLEEVWKWRNQYGSTIIKQLKKLGCSCDWQKERFTMDEGLSQAVTEVFIRLYDKGLIYRDKYIINWCPRCQTALSNEESEHRKEKGSLYYIRYPLKESTDKAESTNHEPRTTNYITVATTRPETMLGDVAVAVHPEDTRYKAFVGRKVILPFTNREIEIIADKEVNPEFGTGAVKVTPAHDPNDFEMGRRHKLAPVVVMNPDATMNEQAGDYEGMDRLECREVLLLDLKERKLLAEVEAHEHSVGHCYRCHTVIEPYISEQWFVKMKPLAKAAIEAVEKGEVRFYPPRWKKVYLEWMYNIRDWCISRQIWWGHRIPAWYCVQCHPELKSFLDPPGGRLEKSKPIPRAHFDISLDDVNLLSGIEPIVSKEKPTCKQCALKDFMVQDPQVLDTWFSSWLWPFSTLGWPETTEDLSYFYPTSSLVTAQEIIFFWVARMIMAGIEFPGEIPFKDVYIHGTVRDSTGTKMSKSLGNVIDPLDIIAQYGADALRFSLVSITAFGQDVFLSKSNFELGRNFANKLWNASRFVLMNSEENRKSRIANHESRITNHESQVLSLADRWILSRLNRMIEAVTASLSCYRFNEAANRLYGFFWHEFCDWYLELIKPVITQDINKEGTEAQRHKGTKGTERSKGGKEDSTSTQGVLYFCLETMLKLLHPFMPFITEEIWQKMGQAGCRTLDSGVESIMLASWPKADKERLDEEVEEKLTFLIDVITSARNLRAEANIGISKKLKILLKPENEFAEITLKESRDDIRRLSGAGELVIAGDTKRPDHSLVGIVKDVTIFIPLKGVINIEKETERIKGKIEELDKNLRIVSAKINNHNFLSRAPKQIVEKEKQKEKDLKDVKEKLKHNLKLLK